MLSLYECLGAKQKLPLSWKHSVLQCFQIRLIDKLLIRVLLFLRPTEHTHNMINYCTSVTPRPPVLMASLHCLFQTQGEQEETSPRVTVLINRTVQQLSTDLMRKPVDSGESPRYPCFLETHRLRRTHGHRLRDFWKSFTFACCSKNKNKLHLSTG